MTILATKPNLRLVVDPRLAARRCQGRRPDPTGSLRSAGGAVLVTAPDTLADDPATWPVASKRGPSDDERRDLDLAWRLVRGVTSNAIVLVRDGRLIGMGSGQTSRVDAARGAVAKARAYAGDAALDGAACASDAFYPFPDAVEACLEAGVTAFVQPGGSVRDAEVAGRRRRRRRDDAADRHPPLPALIAARARAGGSAGADRLAEQDQLDEQRGIGRDRPVIGQRIEARIGRGEIAEIDRRPERRHVRDVEDGLEPVEERAEARSDLARVDRIDPVRGIALRHQAYLGG